MFSTWICDPTVGLWRLTVERARAVTRMTKFIMAGITALVLAALPATAQDRPQSGTIKLVVPSAAGGVHDIAGRLWAEGMKVSLGTIVIDNRGGAGGVVAMGEVARATRDGSTLLLGSNSSNILTPLIWKASGKQFPLDPIKDFEVITVFAGTATAIAVNPVLPIRSLKELIAHVRANPGQLTYAHAGVGAISHVAGEMFKQLAGGLDVRPVPYRGMGPAQADVINGSVSMFVPTLTGQVVELHNAGQSRLLAVNSTTRHPALPGIETALESGLPGMITQNIFAIFGPAGMPRIDVDRINAASRQALAEKPFQDRLTRSAFDAILGLDVDKSRALMKDEYVRWEMIIKAANIKE